MPYFHSFFFYLLGLFVYFNQVVSLPAGLNGLTPNTLDDEPELPSMESLPGLIQQNIREKIGDDLHSALSLASTSKEMNSVVAMPFEQFAVQFLGLSPNRPTSSFQAFRACMKTPRMVHIALKRMCHVEQVTISTCFRLVMDLVNQDQNSYLPIPVELRTTAALFITKNGALDFNAVLNNSEMSAALRPSLFYLRVSSMVLNGLQEGRIPTSKTLDNILANSADRIKAVAANHILKKLIREVAFNSDISQTPGAEINPRSVTQHAWIRKLLARQLFDHYRIAELSYPAANTEEEIHSLYDMLNHLISLAASSPELPALQISDNELQMLTELPPSFFKMSVTALLLHDVDVYLIDTPEIFYTDSFYADHLAALLAMGLDVFALRNGYRRGEHAICAIITHGNLRAFSHLLKYGLDPRSERCALGRSISALIGDLATGGEGEGKEMLASSFFDLYNSFT